MPRRYRRRRYTLSRPLKTVKYSNETASFGVTGTIVAGDTFVNGQPIVVVPPTNVAGTRKVKNFTCRFLVESVAPVRIAWAVVYVPDQTTPSNLSSTSNPTVFQSLYEPNQNVIMSGLLVASPFNVIGESPYFSPVTPSTFKSRLARNLNSGDSIQIVWVAYTPNQVTDTSDTVARLTGQVNFAISY